MAPTYHDAPDGCLLDTIEQIHAPPVLPLESTDNQSNAAPAYHPVKGFQEHPLIANVPLSLASNTDLDTAGCPRLLTSDLYQPLIPSDDPEITAR